MEEVTWERDNTIHANYPFLFEEEDHILPKQWELLAGTWKIQASYTGSGQMDPQISAGYYEQSTLFQRWRYDTNRLLVDADSAGNVDIRRSTIGYVYTLGGTAVSWGSQLQKIVALSTTEAEDVSITEANKDRDH